MGKKKDVHPIVSGAGWIATFLTGLFAAVRKLGKQLCLADQQVDEKIHQLSTPAGETTMEQIAALVLGQTPTAAPSDWWHKFLAMMIRACEFVSYINPDITGANFPYQSGDLELKPVEVFSIKQRIQELCENSLTTQQVLDYLDSLGYRPARLTDLLWWWITNPTKRSNCLVVALGSVGGVCVPFVGGDGSCRELRLCSVERDWDGDCEFAAVRK